MNYQFDGILETANNQSHEVDVNLSPPIISGAMAKITIRTRPKPWSIEDPANPCVVKGSLGEVSIKIAEILYRTFPLHSNRLHAQQEIEISHVGSLHISRPSIFETKKSLTFFISPVEFLEKHPKSALTRYSSNPEQKQELFALELNRGNVIFSKQWAIAHHREDTIAATIHAGYYADVDCNLESVKDIERTVAYFREVCHILSVYFRQAITIHGWEYTASGKHETIWLNPLKPNLAPFMPPLPPSFLAWPNEFKQSAEQLINAYKNLPQKRQSIIRTTGFALAPHVDVPVQERLLSLFSAFEKCLNWEKISKVEKEELARSNQALIDHLEKSLAYLDHTNKEAAQFIAQRIKGFQQVVRTGAPSFSARLALLRDKYPSIKLTNTDLWPVDSSSIRGSIKEIRNALAHGKYESLNFNSLSAATWHFSIYMERAIFILCSLPIPKGIQPHSSLFSREIWYEGAYWRQLLKDYENPET